jgi:hypothetical protein
MNDSRKNSNVWGVAGFTSCSRTAMSITVTFRLSDRERALFLEELKVPSQKPCEREDVLKVKRATEEECDEVRVVWLRGTEYLSTRDVVKHMIEKTGIQVVRAWTRVKAGIDAEVLATHKFKWSGEVLQDVTKRHEPRGLLLAMTGEAAARNRGRMLAAIAGDDEVAGRAGRPVMGALISEEQLLEALDELNSSWLERVTGVPGAKRARRA